MAQKRTRAATATTKKAGQKTQAKSQSQKNRQKAWFIKVRGSYLPQNWPGLTVYVLYVVYILFVMIDAFKTQSTVGGVILFIFPQWIAAIVAVTWVASRHSG